MGIVISVLIFLTLCLKVKGTENENRKLSLAKKLSGMDSIGCLMFIGAVCCHFLALQWGGQSKPWDSSTVIGLLVGFFTLSCVFAL